MLEKALEKLDRESRSGKFDKYAAAMKSATLAALEDFCRQNEEFAQAVVQGGSFEDCMKAVAKNCGSSLSDLEAYGRAVRFYFPGAAIRFQMALDLAPHANDDDPEPAPEVKKAVVLNLADFL